MQQRLIARSKIACVRVRLLGGFEVEGVTERDLGSRKARTLLKLLTVRRGTAVGVDAIIETLWPDDPPARPADQVGVLVSRLRAVLGGDRIRRTDAGYTLEVDWTDLDDVDALTSAATAALSDGRIAAARAASRAALDLVRGPLLGDEDAAWIEPARATAAALLTRAHRVAVDAAVAAGDRDDVVALSERVLTFDPYDEVVLRALMRAHIAARRPASALSAYARVRELLAEDLGVPPTAETEALHGEALLAADGDHAAVGTPVTSATSDVPVGRADHIRALTAALDGARRGETHTVVVEGDPGMGKTTLVEAWVAGLDDDVVVLQGRCDELGRDLPLQPIADALADHARRVGAEAARAILGDDAPVLAPLVAPISGSPTSVTAVADPDEGRARIYAALVAATARAAGGRPLVIVVEDLHMAGPSTIAWVAFAQRRSPSTVFVLTTRDRPPASLSITTRLTVGPLSVTEVTELVGVERAGDVFERSGGHPLLVRALTTAGTVSLEDAVATQADALAADAVRSLHVAAVAGLVCDPELIAVVTGRSTVDVIAHLEEASRTGLIVVNGPSFAFRHEIVRATVERLLSAPQRAAVHRDIAEALATRSPRDDLAVAVHARAGGAPALAGRAFVAAAEAAAARYDLDAAERHLGEAIDAAPESPEPLVARARVRMSRSAFDHAEHDAAAAIARGGGAAALEVAGWIAYYRRRYAEALAHAEEVVALAAPDSALRVSAAALAGRVRHGAGDLRGALAHLTSPGEAPLAVRGVADVWLAQARLHEGRPVDALAALTRPLIAPDSLAHPWAPLHLRFNRAMALGQLGRVAEALDVTADLVAVASREGAIGARFAAPAANVRSWLLRWSGRGDEADDENRRALAASGDERGPAAEGFAEGHYVALLDLADGRLLADDVAGAEALLPRLAAIDDWHGTMSWHQRHRLALIRSRIALADGDRTRSAELAASVATDAADRGAARYELIALAHAGLADGDVPAARLQPVVEGLSRCAALDGWSLVVRLGRERRVDQWCRDGERMAAAMVRHAGTEHAQAARALVDRVVSG